jgi:putative PIN family toxin of toxin-antitoxin system
MKVVLDCNIWVSYIISRKLAELTDLVQVHHLTLFSCDELACELADVLSREKLAKYLTKNVGEYVDFYKDITTEIIITSFYKDSPDAKDNYLFDLAIQSGASCLVTGDKALLALGTVENVKVISWTEFKAYFNQVESSL